MTEYLPNRFECCDAKLPTAFNYCPNCATLVPRRPDTPEIIAERKRLQKLKGYRTRIQSLTRDIEQFKERNKNPQLRQQYEEFAFPRTVEDGLSSMERELETLRRRLEAAQ